MNKEKVVAVTVKLYQNNDVNYDNRISELNSLIEASDGVVVSEIICNRKNIDNSLYIGKGKVEEIKNLADTLEADTIVFNNDLSGTQIKNLSNAIDKKIIDRTSLILEIFAKRTKSDMSTLQVKLAQMEYMLPRLVGYRNNLSKASAGIGTRGLGEQKLELDRRHIYKEIDRVKDKLEKISSTRDTMSKRRRNNPIPIISLVGYTNAGKSTIANKMVNFYKDDKEVLFEEKDMLFMTLDTTTRKGKLPNGFEILVADTVGFIEDLPTKLIESFKSTLEEIEYADCILNIVDYSDENIDKQINTTYEILKELDISGIPILNVFNKIDLKSDNAFTNNNLIGDKIYISAYNNENIEKLLNKIEDLLGYKFVETKLEIPYNKQNIIEELREKGYKMDIDYSEKMIVKLAISERDLEKFKLYVKEN